MKLQLAVASALSLAVASPIAIPVTEPVTDSVTTEKKLLAARQFGTVSAELEQGPCRKVTFIFARGSTEGGNMGSIAGPGTCSSLKQQLGATDVACQGVGGPYTAGILDNVLPGGTTSAAIGEATRLFNEASTKCPSTIIVAGGYSQGAAVMHGSISKLPPDLQAKIAGVVLYGDSRNAADGGKIPNFDPSKTKIICALGDGVCTGTLTVTATHLLYGADTGEGAQFLASKVGTAPAAAASPSAGAAAGAGITAGTGLGIPF